MSNALTTAARPLVMDPSAKAVLMALCDMAREPDDPSRPCEAWPPMHGQEGSTGLCDWTCLSERPVQKAIQRLVADGIVARRQLRHGVVYTILLLTPVAATPVAGTPVVTTPVAGTVTPVAATPKALQSTSRKKKASPSPSKPPKRRGDYPMPDGCDPQAWADFLANRKRKRLPNTASAHKTLMDDLTRHATDAWPVPRLIAFAAGKGWASVRNPEGADDGRRIDRTRADALARPRRGYAADMLAAAHARPSDDPEGDPRDSGGTQGEVPAWLGRRP